MVSDGKHPVQFSGFGKVYASGGGLEPIQEGAIDEKWGLKLGEPFQSEKNRAARSQKGSGICDSDSFANPSHPLNNRCAFQNQVATHQSQALKSSLAAQKKVPLNNQKPTHTTPGQHHGPPRSEKHRCSRPGASLNRIPREIAFNRNGLGIRKLEKPKTAQEAEGRDGSG